MVVTAGDKDHTRSFPGKVEAARRVELAFQVPGLLIELPVREGQNVLKGEVIGRLRPDEFQARLQTLQGQLDRARASLRALQSGDRPEERLRLEAQLRAAEARLANARAEYRRYAALVGTRAVARVDYDAAETAYRVAQEEFQSARQLLEQGTVARDEDIEAQEGEVRSLEGRVVEASLQLEDATLRAPFDGVIAQRFVEVNQNVRAKEPIVRFQDVDEIEVLVDVPETVMAADLRTADLVRLTAEFSGAPGVQFPVYLKEIAKAADPITQTFQVRVGMKAPEGINLLPGMTSIVTVTYRRARILDQQIRVPITAVYQDATGEQIVWVIGSDMTVSRRPVKLGTAAGSMVEITEGLQPGDRIATAGVRFLSEGTKVRDLGDALGGS
jgi:RND family efflux transporter MFP subunit